MRNIVSPLDGIRSPFRRSVSRTPYGTGSWVPTLVLDYKRGVYISAPSPTVTRAGTATYTAADGSIVAASVDTARFDYRGAGGVMNSSARWLLVEGGNTNVAWPSQSPVTKTVTVTAGSWTVSWFGTGAVTLSGVATGSATGTGALVLTKFTATATAGSLTYTVSGDVQELQIESGSTATSRIRTTTASVARSADAVSAIDLTGIYSYGPELVTNGDFSAGLTGWTSGANWSASGGVATCAAPAANSYISRAAGIQNGKSYLVTFDIVSKSGAGAGLVFVGANNFGPYFYAAGKYRAVVTPTTATDTQIWVGCPAGETITIDNISVREITTPSLGVVFDGYLDGAASFDRLLQLDAGSDTGARVVIAYNAGNILVSVSDAANASQASLTVPITLPSRVRLALRYSLNQVQFVCNGVASTIDTSASFAAPQYARIGSNVAGFSRPARMGVAQLLIGPAMTEAEALILGAAA